MKNSRPRMCGETYRIWVGGASSCAKMARAGKSACREASWSLALADAPFCRRLLWGAACQAWLKVDGRGGGQSCSREQAQFAAPRARSHARGGVRQPNAQNARGTIRALSSLGAGLVEFCVQRFRPLNDGEFDGDAVFEMTHDLTTHRAKRHLDADCRLDLDLDGRARK